MFILLSKFLLQNTTVTENQTSVEEKQKTKVLNLIFDFPHVSNQ